MCEYTKANENAHAAQPCACSTRCMSIFLFLTLIAVGVIRLPSKGIAHHITKIVLSLPSKLLLCLSGICIAGGNIAWAARADLIRHGHTVDSCKRLYHVKDTITRACAEIKDLSPLLLVAECRHMAARKIHHMDKVTHAGTIRRWVVVTKHRKLL